MPSIEPGIYSFNLSEGAHRERLTLTNPLRYDVSLIMQRLGPKPCCAQLWYILCDYACADLRIRRPSPRMEMSYGTHNDATFFAPTDHAELRRYLKQLRAAFPDVDSLRRLEESYAIPATEDTEKRGFLTWLARMPEFSLDDQIAIVLV
jgi:hypothetical protein